MQEAFRFYKNKTKPPDLLNVIDCTDKDNDKVRQEPMKLLNSTFTIDNFL